MSDQPAGQAFVEVPQAPEPDIGACYGHAWKRLWSNIGPLLLVFLVYFGMSLPGNIPYVGIVYSIFVMWAVGFGMQYVWLRAARDETIEVGALFEGFKCYGSVLLAMLLTVLIVLGGMLLLVVPGVIFACKLAFVPFLVMDRKMAAVDAIGESWRMTKGYALTVFLIGLVAIPIMFAGVLCCCVGAIPAWMWVGIALASLYYSATTRAAAAQAQQPA